MKIVLKYNISNSDLGEFSIKTFQAYLRFIFCHILNILLYLLLKIAINY